MSIQLFFSTFTYGVLIHLYLYIVLFGFGYYCESLLKKSSFKIIDLCITPWLGLLFVVSILFMLNLISPLNWKISILMLILATPGFLLLCQKAINQNKARELLYFILSIFLITGFAVIITIPHPQAYDYGLYHYQSVRVINSYEIIPGLSNLHHRLGNISALYNLQAIISFFPFGKREAIFNISVALFLSLFLIYQIQNLIFCHKKNKELQRLHFILIICIMSFWHKFMYPSDIAQMIIGAFIAEFLYKILFFTGTRRNFERLVFLSTLAISIKLSGAIFATASVFFASVFLIKKYKKLTYGLLAKSFFIASMCLIPFNIHHVVKTGFLVYPASYTDLKLPWSNIKAAKENADAVTGWARSPGGGYRDSLDNYKWIPNWWSRNGKMLFPFMVIFCISALYLIYLICIEKRRLEAPFRKPLKAAKALYVLSLLYAPSLLAIIFWFFRTADFRFSGFLFFAPIMFNILIISKIKFLNMKYSMQSAIAFFLVIFFLSNYKTFYNKIKKLDNFTYPPIPIIEKIERKTKSDLTVFLPKEGEQVWDMTFFPNTPYLNKNLTLLGNKITDGFAITTLGTRFNDLNKLKSALEDYLKKNAAYPVSEGFDGLYTKWGESSEEWIKGLAPKYIDKLPRDPRKSNNPSQQYLYKSDGKNYKLIANNPPDCERIKNEFPDSIDPQRDCWAYGYWSKKGIAW